MAGSMHPSEGEAMQAASEVASDETLLPGETNAVSSPHLDDAQMWLATYEELFAFKQSLLSTLVDQANSVRREGRHEVQNDEILLTREADRLARRLQFWQKEVAARRVAGSGPVVE